MLPSNSLQTGPSTIRLEQSSNRAHREIDTVFSGFLEVVNWSGFQLTPDQLLDGKLFLMELRTALTDSTESTSFVDDIESSQEDSNHFKKKVAKAYLKEKIRGYIKNLAHVVEASPGNLLNFSL